MTDTYIELVLIIPSSNEKLPTVVASVPSRGTSIGDQILRFGLQQHGHVDMSRNAKGGVASDPAPANRDA